jgi:phenylalanyl-tRNA synthetase beta chain
MHAFDLDKINGSIRVRNAIGGEKLHLLNEQWIELETDTLVICDRDGPLALAGIMGGSTSSVSGSTREIFLECAFFSPSEIMGKARKYGLNTDSSHRFERGVSYELQQQALEYATQLILQISGGQAGPVVEQTLKADLPVRSLITLRKSEVLRVLGLDLDDAYIETTLNRLGLELKRLGDGWQCIAPAHRFDIAIEADLIEELGRVYGYDKIPIRRPLVPAIMRACSESVLSESRIKDIMVDRGYQEAITYSFVDPKLQAQVDPEVRGLPLCNPISSEMAVMRTNLWVGLLDSALRNNNRQIKRVRLFETGLRFIQDQSGLKQVKTLAFLSMGPLIDEQWGIEQKEVDFFDVKSDLEALLELTGRSDAVQFLRETKACLHPGQSARVYVGSNPIGWIGMLHPRLERALGFEGKVFLVELDLDLLVEREVPRFKRLSKFPSVRRDLAVLVRESVEVGELLDGVKTLASPLIRDFAVFDVYQGAGIEPGFKSVAFRLVLQDNDETLTDSVVEQSVQEIFKFFEEKFEARLRD